MRYWGKMVLAWLAVIFTVAFWVPMVYADGGGIAAGPGPGLAISSDAPGAKLVGELFTEHWNYRLAYWGGYYAAVFRAAVRLRSGNVLQTYFLDMDCSNRVNGCSDDPNDPNCLLLPICKTSIPLPDGSVFDCSDWGGCYDAHATEIIQKSLMIWWASQPDFCNFLANFNLSCGEITLKSLNEYAGILATDPDGVPTRIHLSHIEIAVK